MNRNGSWGRGGVSGLSLSIPPSSNPEGKLPRAIVLF